MARTFVLAFKKSDDADAAIGEYKTAGYKVAKIGPTDQLELKKETDPSTIWRSGADGDWTVIIATKDGIELDTAPAPAGGAAGGGAAGGGGAGG